MRSRGSSPGVRFWRGRAGGGSSTERAKLGGGRRWRWRPAGSIRPAWGTAELVEGRSGFGARCSGLERDESKRGGEQWPAWRTAATLLSSGRASSRKGKDCAGREASRPACERKRVVLRRDCRRVEAAPTSTVAGMAGEHTVSSTVQEQERHSKTQ